MTITLCGPLEDCLLALAIIRAAPSIEVLRESDPMTVADGSGRFRIYLAVVV